MHLKPTKTSRDDAEADPLVAIAGAGGVSLFNSQGNPWTADYLKMTASWMWTCAANIAAEARAKIVYERLIDFCDDPGTKDALQLLMTREITHMKAFTLALESMGKQPFSIGEIPPTRDLVNQYFNDSTGEGPGGERDAIVRITTTAICGSGIHLYDGVIPPWKTAISPASFGASSRRSPNPTGCAKAPVSSSRFRSRELLWTRLLPTKLDEAASR